MDIFVSTYTFQTNNLQASVMCVCNMRGIPAGILEICLVKELLVSAILAERGRSKAITPKGTPTPPE